MTTEANFGLLELNSDMVCDIAGANIDEASDLREHLQYSRTRTMGFTDVTNFIAARTNIMPHFSCAGQLRGLYGSWLLQHQLGQCPSDLRNSSTSIPSRPFSCRQFALSEHDVSGPVAMASPRSGLGASQVGLV